MPMLPISSRCLVTGASGYIGRRLCRRLLSQGHHVLGVVRRPTEFSGVDERHFQQVGLGSIDGATDWKEVLQGIDQVFHLAASGGDGGSFDDQLKRLRQTNVEGTRRLASACATHQIKRFVYLSSIKVLGEQSEPGHPWSEADLPNPITPYGISKWEAEQAVWRSLSGGFTEAVVVRPPLVYGPGVQGNFLQLMKLVSRQIPLPFVGLTNRRSMIYLENLLDVLYLCASHPAAAGRTYLVSDGEDVSTGRLVTEMAELMGFPSRLFYFPENLMSIFASMLGKSEQAARLLGSLAIDSTRVRAELNWSPAYSMHQGLNETISWYKGIRRAALDE